MKPPSSAVVLSFLLVTCSLLSLVDGRKSRGGSRGGGKSPRGGGRRAPQPSAGPDFGNSPPKKAPASDLGWNGKHEVPVNSKPVQINTAPNYPTSGGLSGSGKNAAPAAAGTATGVAGGAAHAYPQSTGLSGAGSQGSYPAGTGLSGGSPANAAPPPNAAGTGYNAPPPYSANAPSYGYNQPAGPPPPYGAGKPYSVPGAINNPLGGPPLSYGNTFSGNGLTYMGGKGTSFFRGYGSSGGFVSNNKLGLILTGITVWNLMRSGKRENHYHYYNNGSEPERGVDPETEAILKQLSNCTLTMTSFNETETIAIPCEIATSFAPNAKLDGAHDTKSRFTPGTDSPLNCTITVFTNSGLEIKTNIPCDTLSSMAPKDSVPAENGPSGSTADCGGREPCPATPTVLTPVAVLTDDVLSTSSNATAVDQA